MDKKKREGFPSRRDSTYKSDQREGTELCVIGGGGKEGHG